MAADPHDLRRFVAAQDDHDTYAQALRELRTGAKRSHWMWFVFPQVAGLGQSSTARHFAIASLDEARAYLAHPVLGPRLLECTRALTEVADGVSAAEVLGGVDAMKLRSSMTLFAAAAPDEALFTQVLDRFYDGVADPATTQRI